MRLVPLFAALWLSATLPVQAAPQAASPPDRHQDPGAQAHASHNRIGTLMGSLTQALREAAEQRQQAHQTVTTRADGASVAASAAPLPAGSLAPDAGAQAAVP